MEGTVVGHLPFPRQTEHTAARLLRGHRFAPLKDGWLLIYEDLRPPPTPQVIDELCIVQTIDGKVLVRIVKPGRKPGRWDLLTATGEQTLDAELAWAQRVTLIVPFHPHRRAVGPIQRRRSRLNRPASAAKRTDARCHSKWRATGEAHRGVDAATLVHGSKAGAVSQMGQHQPTGRYRSAGDPAQLFQQIAVREAVKSLALHASIMKAARDRQHPSNERQVAVECGIKAGELWQPRVTITARLHHRDLGRQMFRCIGRHALQLFE